MNKPLYPLNQKCLSNNILHQANITSLDQAIPKPNLIMASVKKHVNRETQKRVESIVPAVAAISYEEGEDKM